ncbi:lipopolysaccharide biosynthesis protein [Cognatiyoonia sp. IB215182]|uniref:GumC family protein n=1 Tax=Cognatiyoonia sp. IB215182 TaxID=3097353 RepID=UPI002A12B0BB|nr:lipopolysaccharide biosynthesis protein [Cognatiyoonia sp. IB215182]MDX8353111.1 lipopolysaccharide biosynthesis protein [Cognatiyoonia sp. IB215182]
MIDFRFYLAVFWRRFPYFFVLLCLGTAVGLAVALTQERIYVAEARLVVESEQIPGDLAASTVRTDATEQLQIIRQRILARDNLLEMANRLGVYRGVSAPEDQLTPDERVMDMRNRIRIQTSGTGRGSSASFVTVSFDAPEPQMAAAVTNEVVTLILQENIEMRTTVSGQTLEFFSQETERLEQELSQMSARILEFQEANLEALPDSLEFRRSQQAAEQERLLELEREKSQLRDRRERLVELFEQTGEVGLVGTVARTPEEAELQELQDELTRASAVLSSDNPRIAVIRAQISALEQIVSEQQAAGAIGLNAEGTQLTPFELQLADLDGQIAFIDEQKTVITANLERLAASIAATPGNAITLGTLERNFDNLRAQYDQAVRNRSAAEVGDTIEALSKGQRISVIEQASVPTSPTHPNRRRIVAMGIAAGLGMGLGLIALLELINTAVRRPIDIVNGLQITPIMTMPYIRTRGEIWRKRLIISAVVVMVLVGLPAAIWYIDAYIRPLQPILDEIMSRVGLV